MRQALLFLLSCTIALQAAAAGAQSLAIRGKSPIGEPYSYVRADGFSGPEVPESPDPLVAYRWRDPKATDPLEIYLLKPKIASADVTGAFENLQSLLGDRPDATVNGAGVITLDFGRESPAWVEFDSPDCPGNVEMSISEYRAPFPGKTRVPVKHGNTYRLELNKELYEGVRFAWIEVKSPSTPWHITGIRAVCQAKPVNYNGSFSCSDPLLTRIWYTCAYSVRAAYCKDYFGAILMDRGDRISWTGDAHISQGASLVAFGNYDFIKRNLENTAKNSNGIRSYSLYWVLSLLDYCNYTGDNATLTKYIPNACAKLDDAYQVFGTNPGLRFYGWDDRLCAGFEIWFRGGAEAQEAQNAYKMLSIRAWRDFARTMDQIGRRDLRDKYNGYAAGKMAELRKFPGWLAHCGLHAAADAVNTGLLSGDERASLFTRLFQDRVNRVSLSPFNQYFILRAMARMHKIDDALSSVRDMWGGMIRYGGTTTFEVYRPSWNAAIGTNGPVPNSQSGIVCLCCPWGAGPARWLSEEVLGIVPTSPGFKTYDVLPHLGRTLTRVSGETPTPLGPISASFDLSAGTCLVSAPAGTLGRIGIPKAERTVARILINGKLAWDGAGHPVAGVGGANQDSEFVYFTAVRPGTYAVSVSSTGQTPVYQEPPERYAAEFVKRDTATRGNWGGVYGKDGYVLCNYHGDGKDERSLPAYVTSLDYYRAFPKSGRPDATMWEKDTSDASAPAPGPGNEKPRNAAAYSNVDQTMSLTIGIDGTRDYQVALYFVDWSNQGRSEAVEMMDAATLNQVAPVKMVKNHAGGVYLVYRYNRSVKFRFNKVRGDIVALSGIFFDPPADIEDYGLKDYVHLSKDLPHAEDASWKLVCTMPHNCHFQPAIVADAAAGEVIRFNSSNPLVLFLRPTETCTTEAGEHVYEAKNWISGEGAVYTIPAGVTVKSVNYRETGYNTAFAGSFQCNDEDYNVLWKKAARTCYLCMRDHFYDCPDRERVGFWGDGTAELDQCFYLFDSASHRLCRDLVRRKLEPRFYPGQHLEFLGEYGLWFYYLHTGDLDSLRVAYEPARQFLFETYRFGNPHTWFDWGKEVKDTAVIEECFYYIDLKALRKMALAAGHEGDVPAIDAKLRAVEAAFDRKYWKGDCYMSGQISTPDDRANAMAVNAGLAGPSKWNAIYENVLTRKEYASCFFDRWVFEALCKMGREEYALLRMHRRYRTMIPCSFTTLWEHYDRWWASHIDAFDAGSSLNHGWNPPALLLSQTIAGIAPESPGWSTYHVLPKEAFLTSIRCVVPSIKGPIATDLRKTASEYRIELDSPQGTVAVVGIPRKVFQKLARIRAGGVAIWDGAYRGGVEGVAWAGEDRDYVKFTVAPGKWRLVGEGTLSLTSPKPPPTPRPNDSPLDKKDWTAAASVPDAVFSIGGIRTPIDASAANALDGDHWTGWRDMTKTQYPGQWFQVDMKRAQSFHRIVLDNTWALWDSPVGYSVSVSNDGTSWSPPIAAGHGELGITNIVFPEQTARYIRITQTGRTDKYHWSIFEIDVYRQRQRGPGGRQ